MKKTVLLLAIMIVHVHFLFGQNNAQDVVYLKNGSTIRGVIIEQIPNKSLKIETADRNVFVFQLEEIEKITKENSNAAIRGNSSSYKKGFIGIALGPSLPIGDFASKDPKNNSAGYANMGAIFDISFAYKFGKQFGIAALIRSQSNSTDAQALADQLSQEIPGGISGTVESKMWSIGGYMVGGYGSFQISSKVSFDARLMLGFLSATTPELKISLSGPGGSAWIKQKSSSSSTFAYLIGAGFKFDVGNRICLLTNLDFLGAKPEFTNVEIVTSDGSSGKSTFSQSYGAINLGVGIGYRL